MEVEFKQNSDMFSGKYVDHNNSLFFKVYNYVLMKNFIVEFEVSSENLWLNTWKIEVKLSPSQWSLSQKKIFF